MRKSSTPRPCPASRRPADFFAARTSALPGGLKGSASPGGEHGPIGPARRVHAADLSAYLDQHYASTIALISAAAPLLDKSPAPSIVMLSGGGAAGPRAKYTPYAIAKAAGVRLSENIAQEEPAWRMNAVAPGFVARRTHDSSIAAGKERSGDDPDELRRRLARADSPERAARLIRFLLSDASQGISGRLISAVWDPWERKGWQDQLARSESLGRLRRIDSMQFDEIGRV